MPELIDEARRWLGVPYRHQGRTPTGGFDCIGFVVWCLQQRGVLPAEFERRDYGRLPQLELIAKAAAYCEEIAAPLPGCLLLIRWPGDKRASHAALLAGETMIHTYQNMKVVEHGYRQPWVKWTTHRWKLSGVI